ncbi:MAG: sigma-70 family RNA polymerase sigma factor [bacterium]|nr:sigma-70 family RNA polymerase sigma factor [bacterium]
MSQAEPHNSPDGSPTGRWVRAAKDGDADSFSKLYEHIAPSLLTWAELRLRPAQRAHLDPQDLVQEVWFRAWKAIDSFDPDRVPFRLWLFRVAKNVLLEAVRQARKADRQKGVPGPTTRLFALQNLPDSATAVSRRLARDEGLKAFTERVRKLEDDEQKLVLHCGLEGLPYKDVAERMELSLDAVAKRWQRLRSRLLEAGLPDQLLA